MEGQQSSASILLFVQVTQKKHFLSISMIIVPVVAINKPDFLAGYLLFYVSARYRGDFLAAIENNRNLRWAENYKIFTSELL